MVAKAGWSDDTLIRVRFRQPRNGFAPISVTLFGMAMLVREKQESNALSPIVVTLFGMVTLEREKQKSNARSPIEVMLSGMVTLVRERHELNARLSMAVTVCPSNTSGMDSVDAEPKYLIILAFPLNWRV